MVRRTSKRPVGAPGIVFTAEERRWMRQALERLEERFNSADPAVKEGRIRVVRGDPAAGEFLSEDPTPSERRDPNA